MLFNSDDEDDLLDQIRAVRGDPALVRSLIEVGQNKARRQFDWSVVHEAHERYFKEVVADA